MSSILAPSTKATTTARSVSRFPFSPFATASIVARVLSPYRVELPPIGRPGCLHSSTEMTQRSSRSETCVVVNCRPRTVMPRRFSSSTSSFLA